MLNLPEVYRMYQAGWSLRRLARLLHVSDTHLGRVFERNQLPKQPFHRPITLQRVAELLAQGHSQKGIAERLGVGSATVFRCVERIRAKAPQHARIKRLNRAFHKRPEAIALPHSPETVGPGWAMGCAAGRCPTGTI